MLRGGGILSDDVFKHILSIGYEFETHDLTKLSLNGDVMINADTILANKDVALEVDGHTYMLEDNLENGENFFEYIDVVNNDKKSFHVTNDIADTELEHVAKEFFGDTDEAKNEIFSFTAGDKLYRIEFTNGLADTGPFFFSGVEWIATYYQPKRGTNIIIETFVDALKQIFHHLEKCVPQKINLFVGGMDIDGNTGVERFIYHFPGTNLYYMQVHGDRTMDIKDIIITPQMTFRSNIVHAVPIMKQIVKINTITNDNKHFVNETNNIVKVEKCVDEMIDLFHEKHPQIQVSAEIRGFLFFIFYKINLYVNDYTEDVKYLKETLTFQSRHTNYTFYKEILKILQKDNHGKTEAIGFIKDLVNQPAVLGKYIYVGSKRAPAKKQLTPNDKKFGDPKKSFISYFEYFSENEEDWFDSLDSKTTISPIIDNNILLEYRLFFSEFENLIGIKGDDDTTLTVLKNFVASTEKTLKRSASAAPAPKLATPKMATPKAAPAPKAATIKSRKDKEGKEYNPKTGRWVIKCKSGFERNDKFQCRKTIKKTSSPPKDKEYNPKTGRWVIKCKPGFERNDKFQCRKTRKNP